MKDQAEQLRKLIEQEKQTAKTVAVISGKGGVGKSNFSLNFSILLSKQGKRVLLFDMDIGMGNVEILMGSSSKHSIIDFFQKEYSLHNLIVEGSYGVSYISGGNGQSNLFTMNANQFERFTVQFSDLQKNYDFIIFDFGAGITKESSDFLLCVDEIITITTPEPPAIMDAYSVIKYIHSREKDIPIFLVCNRIMKESQVKHTVFRLQTTLKRFLGKEIISLGSLPESNYVLQAVSRQIPFLIYKPHAAISVALEAITRQYLSMELGEIKKQKKPSFIVKLKNFFNERKPILCGK